jgi:hypothetical protein
MKLVKALIAIAAIGVGSQVFGKAYPGLEVGFTFREVNLISDVQDSDGKGGVTKEDIERTVKLKLLTRGFKVLPKGSYSPTGGYIYVNINVVDAAFGVSVQLEKFPHHFGIPPNRGTGSVFTPHQGVYSSTGTVGLNKKFILDYMEGLLDRFILDYLESNLKYEATLRDKKLRDIDRVIKGAADADIKNDKLFRSHSPWYKRYNALMKPTAPEGNLENDLLPRRLK